MEQKYNHILPAAVTSGAPLTRSSLATTEGPVTPNKRLAVIAACENCRRKKTKCSGERPACGACDRHGLECKYSTAKGESRSEALKRKYVRLEYENNQLRQLFNCIRLRPHEEAYEIFTRLRSSDDPLEVFHAVKEADLLITGPAPEPALETRKEDRALTEDAVRSTMSDPISVTRP